MDFSGTENILRENQQMLTEIIVEQNISTFEPNIERYKKLYSNILSLVKFADAQPDTMNLLYSQYTPLSKIDLQRVLNEERVQETVAGEFYNMMIEDTYKRAKQQVPKKSRAECRWKPEEEGKFLEALESFGEKDLNAIANFIGTRNKIQVRSHLQKYKLKKKKILRADEQEIN